MRLGQLSTALALFERIAGALPVNAVWCPMGAVPCDTRCVLRSLDTPALYCICLEIQVTDLVNKTDPPWYDGETTTLSQKRATKPTTTVSVKVQMLTPS